MTGTDKNKLRGILDAIRFDGKSIDLAASQIESMFDKSELKEKHRKEETRGFYVFALVFVVCLAIIVNSCYQSA